MSSPTEGRIECCHKCAGSTSMGYSDVRVQNMDWPCCISVPSFTRGAAAAAGSGHTAEYCHHARYSCRCRWCHCVRPCSWPWSTSVRKSFALLHVQLHHARDRQAGAGAVSRVVPHGG